MPQYYFGMKLQIFVLFSLFTQIGAAKVEKPNMIVIMCDDLGYADVGFNGCQDIPTPHIDSIARNGVRCTNGYVAYSVCGPSRAGFMTARYPQRFGFDSRSVFDRLWERLASGFEPHWGRLGATWSVLGECLKISIFQLFYRVFRFPIGPK